MESLLPQAGGVTSRSTVRGRCEFVGIDGCRGESRATVHVQNLGPMLRALFFARLLPKDPINQRGKEGGLCTRG